MTKEYGCLTEEQRQLVNEHLDLVAQVLNKHIRRDLSNPDMDWDDLYQTGCLALCKSALLHDVTKPFGPYAARAIRNALLDYCIKSQQYRQPLCDLELEPDIPIADDHFLLLCDKDLTSFIKEQGNNSSGIVQKGIFSLLKKSEGYTSTDLSKEFGVSSNSVRAWMSLAAKNLGSTQNLINF